MFQDLTAIQLLSMALAGWLNRHQQDATDYLLEENRVLHEHLGPKKNHLASAQRKRLAAKAVRLGRQLLDQVATLVTPDTLLRWHRELIARKWTYSRRGPGTPPVCRDVVDLVIKMAKDNPSWGYGQIVGALSNLGHVASATTIRNILKHHGIEPASERTRRTRWGTFLRAHWEIPSATDFFTVEVWTPRGLVSHCVLFVIHLASRRVYLAGITTSPNRVFMAQAARQLTDSFDGALLDTRIFIMDRDTKFTAQFKSILRPENIRPVLCPPRVPNCNAYAEEFVRSTKEECLAKVIPIGAASLRQFVNEYLAHYQYERNHQGLDNALIAPLRLTPSAGPIQRLERLGGLLNYYHRMAA